jgi:hypothetical protein
MAPTEQDSGGIGDDRRHAEINSAAEIFASTLSNPADNPIARGRCSL